jgi:hypothetical protein
MTKESKTSKPEARKGWCPVYDLACPQGEAAASACEDRFKDDYNPLTTFRDAEIEHCAIYRMEQKQADREENEEI